MSAIFTLPVAAQRDFTDFNNNEDSQFRPQTGNRINTDSLGTDKEIPKGIRVWTVDERFGDTRAAVVDTMQAMYQNTTFTEGLRGEYNTLGNMGTARINRIFIPFFTTKNEGSGIGLSLSRQIMRMSNGSLVLLPYGDNKITTFRLRL